MAKKYKAPKSILGFPLSKGTRKDLRKLMKMLERPKTRTMAVTAASGLAAFLGERFAEHRQTERERAATASERSVPH